MWYPVLGGELGGAGAWQVPGVCVVSEPVHLLAAGEAFLSGYRGGALLAVCGEPVSSGPDGGEAEPRYCVECVQEAIHWSAQP